MIVINILAIGTRTVYYSLYLFVFMCFTSCLFIYVEKLKINSTLLHICDSPDERMFISPNKLFFSFTVQCNGRLTKYELVSKSKPIHHYHFSCRFYCPVFNLRIIDAFFVFIYRFIAVSSSRNSILSVHTPDSYAFFYLMLTV